MTYVITEPCIGQKDASCVEACPVDAVVPEDQVPDGQERFVALNAQYHDREQA